MYAAVFNQVAVSTIVDLFELVAPTDAAIKIHACYISQAVSETSEQLPILCHRGTASGSGGTTVTPMPLEGVLSTGALVEANNTAQSVQGSLLHAETFNVLNGWVWQPTPECRPVISPSDLFIVELQTAPAAELTMNGTLLFEEVGG